jgi:hypothetical protein
MAKSALPAVAGRGLASKVGTALVLLSIGALVIKYPHDAAHLVVGAWNLASNIISGIVMFLRSVSSGS